MSRKINKIVIHHTAVKTTTQPSDTKMIASMNNNHKNRIGQIPDSNWSTVAYHFYIWKDWTITQTREVDSIWYANSNWWVNGEAINIVAHGNFDIEIPTDAQYKAIAKKIEELRNIYWDHITIHGHKEFANKSCPWKNFNFDKLTTMLFYEKIWTEWFSSIPEKERMFKNPEAFLERIKDLSLEDKLSELVYLIAILSEKAWKKD